MRHGIAEFRPRQPLNRQLSSETLNRILRELESLRITKVVNGTVRKLPFGTEITVPPQRGGSSVTAQPWDLLVTPDPSSEAEDPPLLVTVRPGTLNGILPSNWDISKSISADDESLYYAKAVITTDGQDVSGVTIEINTTAPQVLEAELFSIPTTVDYLFGLYKAGQTYRVIGSGHISVSPDVWLTVPKSGAEPGELPYELYYAVLS